MKLNYKRTFLIGLAFLGISAFWQLYDNIIPLILKNTFHMEETLTGSIMALDNILAVVLLPVFGAWSDKVDTRFGKRTPFIVVGTIIAVLFMMLIPVADNNRNLLFFIISLGAVLLAMGLYRSPAIALMPDLTPPKLRSQGNAVINVMGAIGALYALIMIQFLVSEGTTPDYTALFFSIAVVMVIAMLLLICTIREKKLAKEIAEEYPEEYEETPSQAKSAPLPKEVKRSLLFALLAVFCYYMSYNGVTTAFSRYAQEVLNMQGGEFATSLMVIAITAFVSYIPLGVVASKIGRRKSIIIGFAMMVLSFISVSFISEFHAGLNLLLVFAGVGGSAVGVNIFPVVIDMCSERDLGRYTGLYYTFSMAAQIVTPIVSGFFMEHVSYRTLFPYAAVFSVLGILVTLQVHHGDSRPDANKKAWEHLDTD